MWNTNEIHYVLLNDFIVQQKVYLTNSQENGSKKFTV